MKTKSEERREKSNEKIKALGIECFEDLPLVEEASEVRLKSIDDICQRAIACIIAIQLACDINQNNDYEESKEYITPILNKFGVSKNLLAKEKKLFDKTYTMKDAINVSWTYEAYWTLIWALGLIDELDFPKDTCDVKVAIDFVASCSSYDEFKTKCKLRNIDEILDELDLYYRYHWACVEKSINPDTLIGDLDSDVVVERRRALEWLVSEEKDWNEISLDT